MKFREGATPFAYLGAPIFKGVPKSKYFRMVVDKIMSKLATWKGKCLTIVGRIELVKSVLQGMLVHTMLIYKWPRGLLWKLDMYSKNFIYSGDGNKKSLTTCSWKYMCKPIKDGGLGIRLLEEFNMAGLYKRDGS